MWYLLSALLASIGYIPHGHCYLWQTPLVALHAVSDILITLSYYSIPVMLLYFIRKRDDIPFREVFFLFGVFILSCGTTHILEVWTLWYPAYWVSGGVKAFTALVSIYTAFDLFPLIPKALSLPSPKQLEELNQKLAQEILERKSAESEILKLNTQLEQRVQERTLLLEMEITERQHTENALRESQRFNERMTQLTPNILYIYDLEKSYTIYCNDFVTDSLGYTPEEIKKMGSQALEELVYPEDIPLLKHHLQRLHSIKNDDYLEIEYRAKNTKGEWRRETLQHQSFRDALTGLYNRRYLEASMTREIHRAKRNNQPFCVVMLDVDHFKQFNDTYGHDAGDLVLQTISLFLQKNTRQSDITCRLGGEEIVIIMLDSDIQDAQMRAEVLRQEIKL